MKILTHLLSSDRMVFTPHTAGLSQESYKRVNEVLITKIKNYLYLSG